jgi:hypothetical protein
VDYPLARLHPFLIITSTFKPWRIEKAVPTLPLFARVIKQRKTERIARWFTEYKKRAAQQPD